MELGMIGLGRMGANMVRRLMRIVEPVLKKNTPVYQYAPNTWGPQEVERVTPPGGWSNPGQKKAFSVTSEEPDEDRCLFRCRRRSARSCEAHR